MKEWYAANPNGFFIACTNSSNRIGCSIVLAIRPEPMMHFIAGEITKREIRREDLYPPEERHAVSDLYVALMMIKLSKLTSMHLAYRMLLMIERLCIPASIRNVYLNTATPIVERTVKLMGGSLIQKGNERADGLNLFRLNFPDSVRRVLARYERVSRITKAAPGNRTE